MGLFSKEATQDESVSMQAAVNSRMSALEATIGSELSRMRTEYTDGLNRIEQMLTSAIQQSQMSAEIFQVQRRLGEIQSQVNAIFTLVAQRSPTLPSGEQKPIHDLIKARVQAVMDAMNLLTQDHASWLDGQRRALNDAQRAFDSAQERLKLSVVHVAIPEQVE